MRLTISYNPYLLETSFLIDGESAADRSWAKYLRRRRLQTWFYPAPNWNGMAIELENALNENEIEIEFEGRPLDYRDLELYFAEWNQQEGRRMTFCLLPQNHFLREEKNILQMLDELVATFQDSPVETMRDPELMRKYEQARSADFDIAVIATMSSGKSTLINALLGQDLLPTANDATTAKISRIGDIDGADGFSVSCSDRDENQIYEKCAATPELLQKYNNEKDVFYVDLEGDIPGISSEALRLRLIDTPGPNNSATEEHRHVTYSIIGDTEQQPIILYILDATKPEIEADANLLRYIATQIKDGGRQTQERFIFVMNKADALEEKKDGTVFDVICRRQEYLCKLGIEGAQIIPICANQARCLRMQHFNQELTEDEEDWVDAKRLARVKRRMLDEAAILSPSCKEKLRRMRQEAQEQGDQYTLDLISTGIIGLELTINEYLEKYAYPYKISQIVRTFKGRIETLLSLADYVDNISKNQKALEDACKELDAVRRKKDELAERREELEKQVEGIEFDPSFLAQQKGSLEGEIIERLNPITESMFIVGGEIPAFEIDHYCSEAKKAEQNVLQAGQWKMLASIKTKIGKDFDPIFNAYGAFIQEIRGTRISNIDFGDLEEVCKVEMVLDAMSKGIDTQSMVYEKTHKQLVKNPERKGFLGLFKFAKAWKIEQEISDGYFANMEDLHLAVINAAKKNLAVQFKQIESEVDALYNAKRQECNAFLENLDDVIETEIRRIDELTEKAARHQLDLDNNQRCKKWMEDVMRRLDAVIQFQT